MAAYSITLSGGGTLLNADGGTLLLDYEQFILSFGGRAQFSSSVIK